MNGKNYCIDGTGRAIDFKTYKVYKEKAIIDNFNNYCASNNVKRVFCQVDRDSEEQVKEGMTTFGVQTKDSNLLTIGIYESNYAACKDQMAVLNSAVQKAQEKINEKRNNVGRKVLIGGMIVFVGTTVAWAGKIKLEEKGLINKETNINITTEMTTEATNTDATEMTTEMSTENQSSIENMSSEQIQQSIDNYNQEQTNIQLENLEQNREELNLNSGETLSIPVQNVEETTLTNTTTPIQSFNYGFNDVVNNATNTQAVIDNFNQQQSQEQIDYVNQLRQNYENEQKVR